MLGLDLAQFLCLPFKVIEEPLKFLKDEKCIEVDGGDLIGEVSYQFSLTDLGRQPRPGRDAAVRLRRPGPGAAGGLRRADATARPSPASQCYPEALRAAVRPPGPQGGAVQRHRPGDHQRQVGVHLRPARQRQDGDGPRHRRLHEHRRRRRSTSRTPSSPTATSSPSTTRRCTSSTTPRRSSATRPTPPSAGCSTTGAVDPRWVRIRRPVIVTGGELNLDMLDLRYNAGGELLPGPAALQGQRRRVPDRRLRPAAVQPQGTAQPLDSAARRPARLPDAWPAARSSRCRSSS